MRATTLDEIQIKDISIAIYPWLKCILFIVKIEKTVSACPNIQKYFEVNFFF